VLKPFSRVQLVETVSGALADRAERDEHERRHYVTMVESMVRAGYSERQITRAVEASRSANR
jgi:predicted Ser/Thr protein kinase